MRAPFVALVGMTCVGGFGESMHFQGSAYPRLLGAAEGQHVLGRAVGETHLSSRLVARTFERGPGAELGLGPAVVIDLGQGGSEPDVGEVLLAILTSSTSTARRR